MLRQNYVRPFFIVPFIVLLAILAAFTSAHSPQPNSVAARETITQFLSQGHVLGFRAGEFFLSNATYALRVQFLGANAVMPQTGGETFHRVEFTRRNVSTEFSRATYANLWDGITLTYDRGGGILRSTYRVEPFANPNAIRLQYNAPVTLNTDGSLTTKFETGQLTESAPIAWQEINGARVNVPIQFALTNHPITESPNPHLAFAIGDYDSAHALYIDPTITWNTFLGGGDYDVGEGIAVDASGNVYVVGESDATWGTPLRAYTAGDDAFVAKLDANGALVWHTFLGGSGSDRARDVAVDEDGNIYAVGVSGATWGTSPAPIRAYTASDDGWVAKLNASGARQWHTFLGGGDYDSVGSVAVDPYGNTYARGTSRTTWDTPLRAHDPGDNDDAFAAKLASNGALTWHTFLGGNDADYGSDIAVDVNQIVYVSGLSDATWGNPIRPISTNGDAFAVRLEADGSIDWNTFLGGTGYDYGKGIGFDFFGNVYVAGNSDTTWGAGECIGCPLNPHDPGTNQDFFVALMDIDGALQWNTFAGGSGNEYASGIAVEGYGDHYVVGESGAAWGNPVRPYTADGDALIVKLKIDGTRVWHTFLGGAEDEEGNGIAINGTDVYAVGDSRATWGSPVRAHDAGDNDDAFVAKLSPPANNAFANATSITGGTGLVSTSTHYADKETGEPYHAGNAGGASVWYEWTPASNGGVTFWIQTTDYDTLLGVYTGSSVDGLTTIASNDDCKTGQIWSCVSFDAVGGTTYQIAVDGFNGVMGGHSLKWACSAKPTLLKPAKDATVTKPKVKLDWSDVCGNEYKVVVKDTATNKAVYKGSWAVSQAKTSALPAGKTYKWFVKACNSIACKRSKLSTFKR